LGDFVSAYFRLEIREGSRVGQDQNPLQRPESGSSSPPPPEFFSPSNMITSITKEVCELRPRRWQTW